MPENHEKALAAIVRSAGADIEKTFEERGISDLESEDADEAVLDVAIYEAFQVFQAICEERGLPADADLFAEVAAELAEEVEDAEEDEDGDDD